MYGLEMVKASEGQLKRGTIYVTLNRMEDKGYIKSQAAARHPNAIGPSKRLYKATQYGTRVLVAWKDFVTAVTLNGDTK